MDNPFITMFICIMSAIALVIGGCIKQNTIEICQTQIAIKAKQAHYDSQTGEIVFDNTLIEKIIKRIKD